MIKVIWYIDSDFSLRISMPRGRPKGAGVIIQFGKFIAQFILANKSYCYLYTPSIVCPVFNLSWF